MGVGREAEVCPRCHPRQAQEFRTNLTMAPKEQMLELYQFGQISPVENPSDQSFVYGTEMPLTPTLISLAPRQLPAGGFGVPAVPCTRCTPCGWRGGKEHFWGMFPSSEGFQGKDGASAPWGPGDWGWMSGAALAPTSSRGVLGVLVVQGAPGWSGIFHQPPARAHPQSRLLLLGAVPSLGFIFAAAPHFGLVPCPFSGLVLLLCFCHDKNSRGGAKIALRRLNMQMLPACPGASSVSAGPLGALHCC